MSPGGTERTESGLHNLSSSPCSVQVSYSGSPAISVVHAPTRLAAKDEKFSLSEQLITLQFNAPTTKGSHHGTLTVYVTWWGGPQPETLRIPVVAHALEISDRTAEETIADERARKDAAAAAARRAKQEAREERELTTFEREHPRVATDRYDREVHALWRAVDEFEASQLDGVRTAHDEVLKFHKEQPVPAPRGSGFEIAMLVLDVVTAGIAGRFGKLLDTGLRKSFSEATATMISDGLKESIKASSKAARKVATENKAGSSKPAIQGGEDEVSADPRIAFFGHQRNAFTQSKSERTNGVNAALRRLMPLMLEQPEAVYRGLEHMRASYLMMAGQAPAIVANESVRRWINAIAIPRLDVHHAGKDARPIGEIRGVIDIGFRAADDPRAPVIVTQAIIRGVTNAIAHRLQDRRLADLHVPVRAYGLPGGNHAELPVAVLHGPDGTVDWEDRTNGSAPASEATWFRHKGGAKVFMATEILSKSLTGHGVVLETDQDPSLEGG